MIFPCLFAFPHFFLFSEKGKTKIYWLYTRYSTLNNTNPCRYSILRSIRFLGFKQQHKTHSLKPQKNLLQVNQWITDSPRVFWAKLGITFHHYHWCLVPQLCCLGTPFLCHRHHQIWGLWFLISSAPNSKYETSDCRVHNILSTDNWINNECINGH